MEIDYEQGLERLRGLLPANNLSVLTEFSVLEARLRENLANRRFGQDNSNDAQRMRILEELTRFIGKELYLDSHFIDLCESTSQTQHLFDKLYAEALPLVSQDYLSLWREGDRLSIQGQNYWIEGPIQRQHFNRTSALYQQAPGRHAQSGQKVWLKQCQVSHTHEAALALKRDLEKEGRLLLRLQQMGQRDFPRLLGSEIATQSTILAYERQAGRSLTATFAALPRPLDNHVIRRLLAGRHSLFQMLHTLHKMNCAHRMLTPETLLLRANSHKIILLDVGLATRTIQRSEGPQFYQAPEQLRGLPAPNHLTDIYQLGALFYYLLTGRQITDAVTAQASGLTPELERLLRKAAAPVPGDRWSDVHAFSRALRQIGY